MKVNFGVKLAQIFQKTKFRMINVVNKLANCMF